MHLDRACSLRDVCCVCHRRWLESETLHRCLCAWAVNNLQPCYKSAFTCICSTQSNTEGGDMLCFAKGLDEYNSRAFPHFWAVVSGTIQTCQGTVGSAPHTYHTQECERPTFPFRPRHGWLIVSEQGTLVFTLIKWNGLWGQPCPDPALKTPEDSGQKSEMIQKVFWITIFQTISGRRRLSVRPWVSAELCPSWTFNPPGQNLERGEEEAHGGLSRRGWGQDWRIRVGWRGMKRWLNNDVDGRTRA